MERAHERPGERGGLPPRLAVGARRDSIPRPAASERGRAINLVTLDIGLFPLGLVLVPTERVPLHIFEPRYRELIGECVADEGMFGIVLEGEDGRSDVGTLATISEVVHVFDDGRMNIVVEGNARVRVVEWTSGRAFPTGEIEPLEDDDDASPDAEDGERALELFQQLADVAGADIDLPDGASGSLAFEIAAHVDFGPQPKQELLELVSERERLRRLVELLGQALIAMTREREVRERAQTNGRGTNIWAGPAGRAEVRQEAGRLVRLGLAAARAVTEARGDDGHPDLAGEPLVDRRAEDDVRLVPGALPHDLGRLVHLVEREVVAAGDREQDALRPDDVGLDERRAQRPLDGLHAAVVAAREADAHQRVAGVLHDRADVGEVEVDEPRQRDEVADALHALA